MGEENSVKERESRVTRKREKGGGEREIQLES